MFFCLFVCFRLEFWNLERQTVYRTEVTEDRVPSFISSYRASSHLFYYLLIWLTLCSADISAGNFCQIYTSNETTWWRYKCVQMCHTIETSVGHWIIWLQNIPAICILADRGSSASVARLLWNKYKCAFDRHRFYERGQFYLDVQFNAMPMGAMNPINLLIIK